MSLAHAPTASADELAPAVAPTSQLRRDVSGAVALLLLSVVAGVLAASSLAALLGTVG
jgi:hypothetical protein